MALFGKKKKKDKKKAKKDKKGKDWASTVPPKPGAAVEERPKTDALEKPEWMRSSNVELDDVEKAIDLKVDTESRSNILKMYEEKYGETLEAPEFSAGLQYEYQLFDDLEFSTTRASIAEEGAPAEAGAEAAPTKVEEAPKEKVGFFGRKKEKVKEAAPGEPVDTAPKPVVEKGPSFFDPDKKIEWGRSGAMCIGLGKPMFPIARLVYYKARVPKGWMKALAIVDILTIVEVVSWIWRVPARIVLEVVTRMAKKKAISVGLNPADYQTMKELKQATAEAEIEMEEQKKAERKAKRQKAKESAGEA